MEHFVNTYARKRHHNPIVHIPKVVQSNHLVDLDDSSADANDNLLTSWHKHIPPQNNNAHAPPPTPIPVHEQQQPQADAFSLDLDYSDQEDKSQSNAANCPVDNDDDNDDETEDQPIACRSRPTRSAAKRAIVGIAGAALADRSGGIRRAPAVAAQSALVTDDADSVVYEAPVVRPKRRFALNDDDTDDEPPVASKVSKPVERPKRRFALNDDDTDDEPPVASSVPVADLEPATIEDVPLLMAGAYEECPWDGSFHVPSKNEFVYFYAGMPDDYNPSEIIPVRTTLKGLIEAGLDDGRKISTRPFDGVPVEQYRGVITLRFPDAIPPKKDCVIFTKFRLRLADLYKQAAQASGRAKSDVFIYKETRLGKTPDLMPRNMNAMDMPVVEYDVTNGCVLYVMRRYVYSSSTSRPHN